MTVEQKGHDRSSALPHVPQNRYVLGLSDRQAGHSTLEDPPSTKGFCPTGVCGRKRAPIGVWRKQDER
jgi:hypothetical protein